MRLITFLSDFGTNDTYVAQVKGAIFTMAPDAVVVDVTHRVPAQDVRAGAFLLWTAVEVFPPGTVHLAVVDPGVGTARRAVAVRSARGDTFVGPDNGLLPMAITRLGGAQASVELTNTEFHRMSRSDTFHGRDVFGPVAGYLSRG
ncbi:MAG TPA: SAM-dependent chlorinase/fluorinase, partial [Myxococcales bacterium]|nr:SAM-dependent chlorinase/fluorinase [Myxococcales bacterium]